MTERMPRAVLVGVNTDTRPDRYEKSMKELRGLAEACGLEVVSTIVQNAQEITHRTYVGSGKVDYIRMDIEIFDADLVIFNESLTPMQVRNLEQDLDTEVLDRTGIILQIFSQRARTREARLQVESARLRYILPRLAGMHRELGRQGGGSGRLSNKGAGEQKIELDRRRIEHRIAQLDRELAQVDRERATQRRRREKSALPTVALVGYTNAGKSTLLNALLEKGGGEAAEEKKVLQKDMLFATLDTAVRRIQVPGSSPFLLADTVGFIGDLPHSLVKAFRSTLEEVCRADLLVELIDFSDPDYPHQIEVTRQTLQEIGAGEIPVLYAYNKCDLVLEKRREEEDARVVSFYRTPREIPFVKGDSIYLAAGKGIGLTALLDLIGQALTKGHRTMDLLLPYSEGGLLRELTEAGIIQEGPDYTGEGVRIRVLAGPRYMDVLAPFEI